VNLHALEGLDEGPPAQRRVLAEQTLEHLGDADGDLVRRSPSRTEPTRASVKPSVYPGSTSGASIQVVSLSSATLQSHVTSHDGSQSLLAEDP
jgi:hypothetical protein